jgi:hypothetical protein
MRHIPAIATSALLLAGCARGYDPAAVPDATVAMHISAERCQARRTADDLKTWSDLEACELASERAFAVTIKMKKMEAFEAYAANMQALAAERDAKRVTAQQVKLQADLIRSTFLADCGCKPKTYTSEPANMMPSGLPGTVWGYETNLGMGQGSHAMGPGPGNFGPQN